ncbi:hypothetical protein NL676_023319 [Syzygium grande]|nr:hypothetical protein NL676_023319 [Syzygium grande]
MQFGFSIDGHSKPILSIFASIQEEEEEEAVEMGAAQSADEKSLHEFVVKVGCYTRSFASGSGISRSRRSRFTVGSRDVLMWVLMMVMMMMQDSKGDEVYLSAYEGKVLLVVNVASNWYPTRLSLLIKFGPSFSPILFFVIF